MKQLCLIGFLIFLVACDGASNPDPEPNPTDKTAPTLTASIPETDSISVPTNIKLAFSFSEAMSDSSLELNATPALALGTATWNEDKTSVVFANDPLAASTAYTVTLNAKDVAGNSLATTTLTFTTSEGADTTAPSTPTGLVATPADGKVTLTWQANSETDVAGYTLYMGTAEDALESKEFVTTNSTTVTDLINGTPYFFTVDALDNAGNSSSQTSPVSATPSATVTDTTSPTIQSSDPEDGAVNVFLNLSEFSVQIVFSEPMDTSSLSFVLSPTSPKLERVTWSEQDTVVTLHPIFTEEMNVRNTLLTTTSQPSLRVATTYTLELNAKDKAGNTLSGDKVITFTTAGDDAPRLVSSDPADHATDVSPRQTSLELRFSKPMDKASLEFTITPRFGASDTPPDEPFNILWSDDDTTVTLQPSSSQAVAEETTFTLTFNAKDKAGNALEGNKDIQFTTGFEVPTLVSSIPANGAMNVPVPTDESFSRITLTFSEAVDPNYFLFITDQGNFPYHSCFDPILEMNDTTAVIDCKLFDETAYTMVYGTQDRDGHYVEGSLSFSTAPDTASPSVIANYPADKATNVSSLTALDFSFDDEMDEASTLGAVSSSSPLGCTWKLSDTKSTLYCDGGGPNRLQPDTTYTITVSDEAKDTSGKRLAGSGLCRGGEPSCSYSFKFSTGSTLDETRPTINTDPSEPDSGEVDVSSNSTIIVVFSEKMNEESVQGVFRATAEGETFTGTLNGTFGWFDKAMVFTPEGSELPICSSVRVTISTEATDRAGNFLLSPYDITFKTTCPS